jgi:hypothetical protein
MNANHLSTLVDSYQLATKQAPPAGQILVHNRPRGASTRGFRAWWAKPGPGRSCPWKWCRSV